MTGPGGDALEQILDRHPQGVSQSGKNIDAHVATPSLRATQIADVASGGFREPFLRPSPLDPQSAHADAEVRPRPLRRRIRGPHVRRVDISTTDSIYTHLFNGSAAADMDRLDALATAPAAAPVPRIGRALEA